MSSTRGIFIIVLSGESIVALFGNGYIALVSCIDWIKMKRISSIDCILASLAISRICMICTLVTNGIIILWYPDIYENNQFQIVFYTVWTLINYLSMHFATCLNVFYFLKVANFSHPFFLWLKWRIDRVIHWLLLGCFALSLLVSLIHAIVQSYSGKFPKIVNHKGNFTEMHHMQKSQYFEPLTLFNLFAMVSFTVSLVTFFLLIISLWRHIKQMRRNATDGGDPSTEAHVRAIKLVTSFLFFFFIYCLSFLTMTFSYLMQEQQLVIMVGETVAILYPLCHSLILIFGNNKLRQASVRMLTCKKM
uniref:taste receptor type 2 member 8 n=1 Tax=Jaculus jaculus TaxID=51337 RepID=UPI0003333F9E|nr:taste receptor type 2 member 8 [Jaculus jaculus]